MRSKDYRQFLVGLPKDSAMLTFYLEEARQNGIHLPTHIYQLLKKRYEIIHATGHDPFLAPASTTTTTSSVAPSGDVAKAHAVLSAFGGEDED